MYKILLSIGIVISSISFAQSNLYMESIILSLIQELNELAKRRMELKYITRLLIFVHVKIENNSGESVQIDWDKSTFVIDKRASELF